MLQNNISYFISAFDMFGLISVAGAIIYGIYLMIWEKHNIKPLLGKRKRKHEIQSEQRDIQKGREASQLS